MAEMCQTAGNAIHSAADSCSAGMDERAAAAAVFSSAADSTPRDGLGVDRDHIESGSRKRRERPGQSEAACTLGNGVDAALRECEDVSKQVINVRITPITCPINTRFAQPLGRHDSTGLQLPLTLVVEYLLPKIDEMIPEGTGRRRTFVKTDSAARLHARLTNELLENAKLAVEKLWKQRGYDPKKLEVIKARLG
jgi:hypothetical protein